MQIHVKLMGILKDKAPPNGQLQLSDGDTIGVALSALNIPSDTIQIFTVNGSLERDHGRVLQDGDDLSIIPPVGGG